MSKSTYYGSDDDDYNPGGEDSYHSSDEESYDKPKKKKKKKTTGKKALDDGMKAVVKGVTKPKVKKKILDDLSYNPNLFLPVAQDLSPFAIITKAAYSLFKDPAGAPGGGGYRGCARVTITLGPAQQLGNTGTNSSGQYPNSIADAEVEYPAQVFVSGHVLNADFGGPDAARNMTILTSSANGQQKTFDNNVKNARNALYNVYMDLAALGPKSKNFLAGLGYGIELDLQVGAAGGRWDNVYPGNCISNQVDLDATIVNENKVTAALANPATYFTNPRQTLLNSLPGKLAKVRGYINTANTGSTLDNGEY